MRRQWVAPLLASTIVRAADVLPFKDLLARMRDAKYKGLLFPLLAGVLILGSAWLFLGVVEGVVSRDPLVDVDVVVHGVLQKLRTPWMDGAMVAVTELGDVEVVLPLVLAAMAWFVWHRLWQTSLYWLAATAVAEVLVKVLKFVMQRLRPGLLYEGVERYSFPSSHATLSVVVYGFLAFLVCREQRKGVRNGIALAAVLLVVSIAFSRLYLGVHWASDVIAGMSFALAWVGALAFAYSYRIHEDVRPIQLLAWLMAVVLLAGSWHIARRHGLDMLRYAPVASVAEPAHILSYGQHPVIWKKE